MISPLSRELQILNLEEPTINCNFIYKKYDAQELTVEPEIIDFKDPLRFNELKISISNIDIDAGLEPNNIVNEYDFLSGDFINLKIDNSGLMNEFINTVSGSLLLLSTQGVVAGTSKRKLTLSLDANTPNNVSTLSLANAVNSIIPNNTQTAKEFIYAEQARTNIRINARIINDVIAAMSSGSNQTSNSAFNLIESSKSIQQIASNNGWIQNGPSISNGKFVALSNAKPEIKLRGFLIDRQEIDLNNKITNKKSIYVSATKDLIYKDYAVKYGAKYRYTVSSVCNVSIPATLDTGIKGVAIIQCKSNGTTQDIVCIENIPPPCPADFNIIYNDEKLLLSWSFPVNTQRDIVKFQIYKRKSLQEPFQILQEIDFSDYAYSNNEIINNVLKVKTPITYYYDDNFETGDIYAIVSVDAHGFSSGYSSQLKITFKNGLLKLTRIIPANCPKAYPNLFYESDPFPDVIFDSNKSKINLIFTPEHLTVMNNAGKKENNVITSTEGFYSMQIISLDSAKASSVKILVNDVRK